MSSAFLSLAPYIEMAKKVPQHAAKQHVLTRLLEEVFNVKLEELLPGIEKKIGSRILGVRGRVDLLYSNVVFEIKVDLEKELEDAKKELKKYFQVLLESNPSAKLVGIATDVINYRAFIPVVENGVVKDVKEVSSINIEKVSPAEAILWLDSYIFSKPRMRPTATDLRFRFGPGSPTYAIAIETLRTLWSNVKGEEDVKLKFDLWKKNMEIVYGSAPSEEAFIEQTYLVTLVKLVAYYWLSGGDKVSKDRLLSALKGEYFAKYGIHNLIEEDFFSWILHREIVNEALELFAGIAKELLRYDLTQIDEDFFKEIYENIVERGQRHRIGEYYTPEWLTELILREVLNIWWSKSSSEPPKILDPACGSGTFLVNAIHIMKDVLKRRGWRPEDVLNYMLTSIVGIDINPLAVTIARANYLFALGELLSHRKGSITIPIYVADSIKLPEVKKTLYGGGVPVYEYEVNGYRLQIPVNVAKDRARFGKVLAAFREVIDAYRNGGKKDEVLKLFERTLQGVVTPAEFAILKNTLNSILALIDNKKDSIWVYMLSNIYIPVALSESKFDIVVGNPPWVIMRYVENKEYQDFVKKLFLSYELLRSNQVHLFTAIEIATAFFCRISDLYLKDNGIIGFVMPRSILTGALQHAEFRKFRKPPMTLHEILDLEKVAPLFNIPACVLIASKGGKTEYPVPARRFSGKLPEKNLKLPQAMQYLKVEEYSYQPPQVLLKSPYYDLFKAGASIYPRTFFFIDFIVHPTLGIDIEKPYCRSSIDPEILRNAKEPWKRVIMEGNVEREFIYATVLSGDLMPFRCEFKPVVLPVKPTPSSYKILDVEDLRREGYNYMASWLEKAQKLWEKLRTKKSEKQFPKVINRLDHQGLLSSQNPNKRHVVIYNTSGANLTSCIVDRQNLPPFKTDSFTIKPVNFVADETTMFYETNNELEALYLCAIFNSDVVNELIKPLQPKGSKGERHIVRRPFVFPIPNFDPNNSVHRRLAELSKACHEKASRITLTKRDVAARRKEVRDALKAEMAEINKLVSQLLGLT